MLKPENWILSENMQMKGEGLIEILGNSYFKQFIKLEDDSTYFLRLSFKGTGRVPMIDESSYLVFANVKDENFTRVIKNPSSKGE
ncbi:hypothetical protein CBR58_32320 [Bacillus thuringiensis]|uniref:Uncharacterized protein n=3 Tax=Bacillus thuringiensis TaxID=1428 RepID=A0ABD5I8K7_BACTU|nr:hypothetical protein [Bacillus thuringiensis]MDW9213597.1 hypothetical protein [Bacillus thuringiensis serovar toumanoffi]AMR88580.1 hypothetical protein A3L20_31910 [Bacillus thuringiensis]MBG9673346.1 hypothetical protein [Bacillus thuringiensis]MCR6869612.1 hypothetical protein [Bacillus thuringiensis]OTZ53642.1 hypothetical protein BK762_08965 [Bacillus thuringiensis serovar toumanoffi]